MERPRVDYDSGTIHGRSHPWVGPAVEGFERGLEKGHLRLLTTKSHGDYPADWFTGAIGERRYDIEGGDPRTPSPVTTAVCGSKERRGEREEGATRHPPPAGGGAAGSGLGCATGKFIGGLAGPWPAPGAGAPLCTRMATLS